MRGRRRDRQPGHRLENTIIVLRGYPLHRRCGGAFSGTRSRTARRPPSAAQRSQRYQDRSGVRPRRAIMESRIASAASGFSTQADKDGRLGEIVLTTAENKRFDASCTAAVLIRDDGFGTADAENRKQRRLPTAHRSRGASSPCTECATRKHKRKPPPCSRNAGKNAMKEGNS